LRVNHRILLGSYPIPILAGIPNHNFLVWTDSQGMPRFEINGGAINPDGSFNYAALFGRLTAVETDYSKRDPRRFPEFHIRPASRMTILLEAPRDEIAEIWATGARAAERIATSGLRYFILTSNSNSVATSVAHSMGLAPPSACLGLLRAPGARRRLTVAAATL
jgi:hypothetical protein